MTRWWRGRRARRLEHAAAMEQLRAEYVERLEAGDEDVRETARDFYDNNSGSWRFEVGLSLYLVVLVPAVLALVGFFSLIAWLTGR